MSGPKPESNESASTLHASRLQLIWDVVLLQFKLGFDGLRDLVLIPLSIAAGFLGLIAGGDDPHQYFRRVMRFGLRSEAWINLFGGHERGTSDELVDGLRQRVFTEATSNPWLKKAGSRLNQRLDGMNAARGDAPRGGDRSPGTATRGSAGTPDGPPSDEPTGNPQGE